MGAKSLWYGYLEAGEKSSTIVRDSSIDTANTATVYLYNQSQGKILEYRLDIVEPKLRTLTSEEAKMIPDLLAAYKKIKKEFVPRSSLKIKISDTLVEKKSSSPIKPDESDEIDDEEISDADDLLDDDDEVSDDSYMMNDRSDQYEAAQD